MFQSRNVEASKSHQKWQLSLFDIRQTKAMMEERQDTKYKLLVAEYETDGSMKFITGEDLELWYRDKIKGTIYVEIGI